MPRPRLHRWLIAAAAACAWPALAHALGLGTAAQDLILGQPIEVAIPVRLEADEVLGPDCVRAEITQGEQRLPAAVVRTRVIGGPAGSAWIRIGSTVVAEEPVVTVQLAVGCPVAVSRRYLLFVEPPAAQAVVAVATAAPPEVSATGALPQADRPRSAAARAPARAAHTDDRRAVGSAKASRRARGERLAARHEARERRPDRGVQAAQRPVQADARPLQVAEARPRLRLDPAEPAPQPILASVVVDQAFEAVAQAASAARAAAAAASASATRAAALEATVEQLRGQARSSQAEIERLRALTQPTPGPSIWIWPLAALLVGVTLLALWLGWRLRALQRVSERAWTRASTVAQAAAGAGHDVLPSDFGTSDIAVPTTQVRTHPGVLSAPVSEPPVLPAAGGAGAMARTATLPAGGRTDEQAPRDVSIEELIDVDQQAEFFIALGQDQAAIDLLVAHLRSTGGGSPLTYLKLLEVYRRVGDQAAYERSRARFNHRYNAYAPEWGSDLTHGRSLEDYEGVLPRLQHAWPRPLDAMAELEALLFRKSRGELFDLPAYRDVLFLYSVARDRLEQGSHDAGTVDVLLPLDGRDLAPTRAADVHARSDVPTDEHPTMPLDLDLTPAHAQASIFGEPLTPSKGFPRLPRL